MTNAVNLAALGFGGLDTSGLVSSLVAIESQPLNQMGSDQQNIQSASTTISSFSSTLSALKTAATALSDPKSFLSMKATSSDPSIVASTTGSPISGQWSVSVSSIAQSQRTLSNGMASPTTALGLSGTLAITVGSGQAKDISLLSTDTMADVANKISSAGLRAQTSLMYDGSQYHLLVAGLDTGAANSVAFDEAGLTGTGYTLGLSTAQNTIQQAQDASLTVGGVLITSATNQIPNAIPGVTLALTQPTTTAATINIASDPTSISQQVQTFVTAYNTVVNNGHSTAGFAAQTATNSLLQGDQAVRSSLDQLGQFMAAQVPGSSGAYTTLASVGVTLNDDGTLAFDSTKLASGLLSDPSSVERLFVTDSTNGSTGVMKSIGSMLDSMTNPTGLIQAEIKGFAARNSEIADQVASEQRRIANYQTQLQAQFTQMNATLAQYKQIFASLNASSGNSSSGSTNNTL